MKYIAILAIAICLTACSTQTEYRFTEMTDDCFISYRAAPGAEQVCVEQFHTNPLFEPAPSNGFKEWR